MSTEILNDTERTEQAPPSPLEPNRPVRRRPVWMYWLAAIIIGMAGIYLGAQIEKHRLNAAKLIASVNGDKITQNDLFGRLQILSGPATLHKMVEEDLQIQYAKSKGLGPSDADVQARYDKLSSQPNFDQELAASGDTPAFLRHELQVQMSQAAVLEQGITITDADSRAYYETQISPNNPRALFYRPEEEVVRAIALPSKEMAESVLASLNGNSPFDLMARNYSVDPTTKANGGLLSPLQRGRSPLSKFPAVESAVFSLPIGQRYGPVQIGNQYWFFLCVDKAPPQVTPYDKVKDACHAAALLAKGLRVNGARVDADFAQYEKTSTLQAFWPQYSSAVEQH